MAWDVYDRNRLFDDNASDWDNSNCLYIKMLCAIIKSIMGAYALEDGKWRK